MHCAHVSKPQERIAKSLLLGEGFFRHRGNISWSDGSQPAPFPFEFPTFHANFQPSISPQHAYWGRNTQIALPF